MWHCYHDTNLKDGIQRKSHNAHHLRIITVPHYEKLLIMITEFICAFSKFQLQEEIQTRFQMASTYILGGNDSDEEREDCRHLDPTLLKRMKKSLMLQCNISGERKGYFCPSIASSELRCFPSGTVGKLAQVFRTLKKIN